MVFLYNFHVLSIRLSKHQYTFFNVKSGRSTVARARSLVCSVSFPHVFFRCRSFLFARCTHTAHRPPDPKIESKLRRMNEKKIQLENLCEANSVRVMYRTHIFRTRAVRSYHYNTQHFVLFLSIALLRSLVRSFSISDVYDVERVCAI